MQRAGKKIVVLILIAFLAISPLRIDFFYLSQNVVAGESQPLEDVHISEDTTWNNDTDLSHYDNIYVDWGVTLTIEKGSQLAFRHLYIYGSIVAIGTMDARIKLAGIPPVFAEGGLYDPHCFVASTGTIELRGPGNYDDDPESIFEFVEFSAMGGEYSYDTTNCPALSLNNSIKDMLLPTAYAAPAEKVAPAVAFYSGRVTMQNCTFENNAHADVKVAMEYGDWNTESFLHIENSNFQHNSQNTAMLSNVTNTNLHNTLFENCFNECKSHYADDYSLYGEVCNTSCQRAVESDPSWHDKTKVTLKNNWYGDASGPKTNGIGVGESIAGDYTLDGWSNVEFADTPKVSNVLFLPGLEASRLYSNIDSNCPYDEKSLNKAWEPNCNDDVRRLYLDSDGKSINSMYTKTGDVLDETPVGSNIYKSFIEQMNKMKNDDKVINDWKAIAYDWRLSLDDILKDGSIISSIHTLAENSKTGKVTIVAHSTGGLLTKALMKELGSEMAKSLVDKIIFVAVPQVGTPAAVAGMLHGKDQGILPVFSTQTARGLSENMPGAYNLLPSEKYFSTVETPVLKFDLDASKDWKNRYDSSINSKEKMDDFMTDDFRRVSAIDSDTDSPSRLKENLLEKANNVHNDLDNWIAPEGVKIVQIAGWGVPSLSDIDYGAERWKPCDPVCGQSTEYLNPDFKFTIDGDGTVVTPSALWMGNVDRYWVDMAKYNSLYNRIIASRFFNTKHADILEISSLCSFIEDNIENKTKNISDYTYLSTEVPLASNKDRLQYSLHSPLTLNIYDAQGVHTGIDKNGKIEERISGTYYQQFGDVKYIFSDEGSGQHIVMDGYGDGTFTFSVDELRGDKSLNRITFKDMPTTPKTKVMLDISNSLASVSKMSIDENGDGVYDYEVAPILNGTVTSGDLIRIEKDVQNDDNDSNGNNHKHKKKKTTQVAAIIKTTPMASIGAKLADAFIIPNTNAYIETRNDAVDKKENKWENRMNDEENENLIRKEIFISLIVLLIIVIFGVRKWGYREADRV